MSLTYTMLFHAWQQQEDVTATHHIMAVNLLGSKARDSVVEGARRALRMKMMADAARKGFVVVALSPFVWTQHVHDALSVAVNGGTTAYTELPWVPGTPMHDGFSHLTVTAKGVAIPHMTLDAEA